MFRRMFFVMVVLCVVGLLLFFPSTDDSSVVVLGDRRFVVEVADTPALRSEGLMFRDSLCDSCGMLFVFSDEQPRSFWMKDTLIPLDIVFLDENFVIVNVSSALPCVGDPCSLYNSVLPARYVLEVNQGFFGDTDIGKVLVLES